MRVAVVGATGNVGTAVLTALHERPEVTDVLGIARRLPDESRPPYSGCAWTSIDIGAATDPDTAVAQLTRAFAGVDAVVHLAWLIQPNSDRALLRRVNVAGTAHVARAVAAAGVPHLAVASSVGAYSPAQDDRAHDETWPHGGIPSSHYSVDKAAQERLLDEFAADHPEILLTRLRPALTFQAAAASEIQRYFLGDLAPVQALRAGRLPALPVPKGLRVQAVHSADVGRAYAAAVATRAPGAFNICADDVLDAQALAEVVDHGHFVELPVGAVRAALAAAHRTGAVPADPGWLDMGMQVPVMDASRARRELAWEPQHTAAETLEELLAALPEGQGGDSVPLRPRDERRLRTAVGGPDRDRDEGTPAIAAVVDRDLLGLYLSDHLTGATAGAERIERMAEAYADSPVFARLSSLAEEIRSERELLRRIIRRLGLKQLPHRQALSWAGERAARLKTNGTLFSRSPMTLVLEAELMRSAVVGKRGGWQTLETNADLLGLDPHVFAELSEKVDGQLTVLDAVHAYARERAFRTGRDSFTAAATGHGTDPADSTDPDGLA